jgi:CheY-like chemotaxis protein
MKRILIADAGKASLVMTSEVFKDFFPGVQIVVARNSAEALEWVAKDKSFDVIVVDYDLPDRDGADTAARIKKLVKTPVLLTGFERPGVEYAITEELAAYDDCMNWVKKPVRPETLVTIAERYVDGKYRTQRRIPCEIPVVFELAVPVVSNVPVAATKTSPKATTKSKKGAKTVQAKPAPKVKQVTTLKRTMIPAYVQDCSVGGVKLRIPRNKVESLTLAKFAASAVSNIELGHQLSIQLPAWENIEKGEQKKNTASKATPKSVAKVAPPKTPTMAKGAVAMKGRVAWSDEQKNANEWIIGIQAENSTFSKKLFDAVIAAQKSETSSTHSG